METLPTLRIGTQEAIGNRGLNLKQVTVIAESLKKYKAE